MIGKFGGKHLKGSMEKNRNKNRTKNRKGIKDNKVGNKGSVISKDECEEEVTQVEKKQETWETEQIIDLTAETQVREKVRRAVDMNL